MKLPFHVVQMLKSRSGIDFHQPADCDLLSLDIEGKTGVHIGSTTLKRLLGFAADERQPHATTLDLIARYLGYTHWDELVAVDDKGNSGFEATGDEVRSANLTPGAKVEMTYLPDRKVVLQYIGDNRYHVTVSQNSKLSVGDEVEIVSFVCHHPLLVINVCRDGVSLGPFTAGRVSGLQSVSIL